jgi:hypothetical protein
MENYDERIKYLTDKVNDIKKTTNPSVENKSFLTNIIPKNINKKYIIIGSVPVIIFIFLIILRPKFILIVDENKNEKINIKRAIIISIISLIIVYAINYIYLYKKHNYFLSK